MDSENPEGVDQGARGNDDRKEQGGENKASGDHLSLKVKSQDGNEVYFKVKKTTSFAKVMNAYCKKVGADPEQVRFLFDGQRLRSEQTPQDLDMEDEDEIDAMVQQTGGSC